MTAAAPEYVLARRALLDVLDVLEAHQESLVLVGAQAVYLHAPGDFGVPAYTTDGDLTIDPDVLAYAPDIDTMLRNADYFAGQNPGAWTSPSGVHIDLLVAAGVASGPGRRSASLAGHGLPTARRTPGLEVALVDNSVMTLRALDPSDERVRDLKVAGPAALTIAKLAKLRERLDLGKEDRVLPKDAGDLLRMLRACDARAIGNQLSVLAAQPAIDAVIAPLIRWSAADVGARESQLARLAVLAAQGTEPDRQVDGSLRALISTLVEAFR
jgi:hypothetical protein